MVNIRVMRVAVHQWPVLVVMGVRLVPVPGEIVLVPVMRIVHMSVAVRQCFVFVAVLLAFGDVQPYTHRLRKINPTTIRISIVRSACLRPVCGRAVYRNQAILGLRPAPRSDRR